MMDAVSIQMICVILRLFVDRVFCKANRAAEVTFLSSHGRRTVEVPDWSELFLCGTHK